MYKDDSVDDLPWIRARVSLQCTHI